MSPFHFCLSAAKNLSSFQLLPASLITDILQLFLGLPLFLFPWGFQSRAAFGISPSSFLDVWPIHLHFLFLISTFIYSCPGTFHRSLLEIMFGYHIVYNSIKHIGDISPERVECVLFVQYGFMCSNYWDCLIILCSWNSIIITRSSSVMY